MENIKDLRESGELPTCTQISVVNMVPLCQQSIYYAAFAFPIGKLFKAEDLSEMFRTLKRDCEEEGISKVSIAGDGDPRMRSFQKQTYCYVSSEFKWLEKLDFPIRYGRSIAGTDFPVSDILHVLKKLRNNNKYLSTRVFLYSPTRETFLLLTDSNSVPDGNVLSSFGTATKSSGTLSQSPPLP